MDEKNIYAIIAITDGSTTKSKNVSMHQVTICAVFHDYDYLYHMLRHMVGMAEDGYKREGCTVTIEQRRPQGSQKWLHETSVSVKRLDRWLNHVYRIYDLKNNPFLIIDDITILGEMKVEESV